MEHNVYLYSAWVGCTLIVAQVVLQVFGIMDDTDVDTGADAADTGMGDAGHDGHGNLFFGILSFKTLSAFAGFFGLTGLALIDAGWGLAARVAGSIGAGFASMVVIGWLMRSLSRLNASGTVQIANAVGCAATVYLRIPAGKEGLGKVTVELQGRSLELPALTDGEAIETGRRVRVVAADGSTLTVEPA